jgi:hypothetical protein
MVKAEVRVLFLDVFRYLSERAIGELFYEASHRNDTHGHPAISSVGGTREKKKWNLNLGLGPNAAPLFNTLSIFWFSPGLRRS